MRLIPFSPDHFNELARWFPNDMSVILWAGPKYSFPIVESDVQEMLSGPSGKRQSRFAWTAKVNSTISGHTQLAFNWASGSALLCRVAVSPAMRGMGYAKPMLSLTIQNAFSHQDVQEVELNVFTFNEVAIAVYRSMGFVNMGILKPPIEVGKELWDTYTMRLPRSTWIREG